MFLGVASRNGRVEVFLPQNVVPPYSGPTHPQLLIVIRQLWFFPAHAENRKKLVYHST